MSDIKEDDQSFSSSDILSDLTSLPFCGESHIPFGSLSQVAPFVSSPISVLRQAAKLLQLSPNDTVYDLGCGAGDFLILAAKEFNIKVAVGIDIAQDVLEIANSRAKECGLQHKLVFKDLDVFEDQEWVENADKVFVYLVPRMLNKIKLKRKFAKLLSRPNKMVVCYYFPFPEDWKPDYVDTVLNLYLYTKPFDGYSDE
jgi:SAM-dependent methyltransferase